MNPGLLHCRWILYCVSYQGEAMEGYKSPLGGDSGIRRQDRVGWGTWLPVSLAARNHCCSMLTAPSLSLERDAESPSSPHPQPLRLALLAGSAGLHQNCSRFCETEKRRVSKWERRSLLKGSSFPAAPLQTPVSPVTAKMWPG